MTDAEVIKTIAEFMGFENVEILSENPPKVEWWYQYRTKEQNGGRARGWHKKLPDYLTSFDAIAPVWEKMLREGRASHAHRKIQPSGEVLAMFRGVTIDRSDFWYLVPPREQAHAIAEALIETKGVAKSGSPS